MRKNRASRGNESLGCGGASYIKNHGERGI